jgi:hypothetical protein|tara:strand:- start:4276 stop:4437 length:162 start_codon:yes stop_codon:yes gene_type:complete
MLEKLLMLCADSEFAKELYQAVDKLEERKGKTPDIEELRCLIKKTIKLCQPIR